MPERPDIERGIQRLRERTFGRSDRRNQQQRDALADRSSKVHASFPPERPGRAALDRFPGDSETR
jgi:hypothetical protein